MSNNIDIIFEKLLQSLPAVIARSQVPMLTGGMISSGTLANHDSKKTGPQGAFVANGKVCYSRESLVEWLKSKSRLQWETLTKGDSNEQ